MPNICYVILLELWMLLFEHIYISPQPIDTTDIHYWSSKTIRTIRVFEYLTSPFKVYLNAFTFTFNWKLLFPEQAYNQNRIYPSAATSQLRALILALRENPPKRYRNHSFCLNMCCAHIILLIYNLNNNWIIYFFNIS